MASAWDSTPIDPAVTPAPSGSAWDQTPAVIQTKPQQAATPNSFWGTRAGRIAYGAFDPIQAGAQMLRHAVPDPVGEALDATDRWLGSHTGGLFKPTDQAVSGNEAAYKAANPGQDIDWYRIGGNVVSPANYVIGGALKAAGGALVSKVPMLAKVPGWLKAAGEGGLYGMLSPSSDDKGDFWSNKLDQAGIGSLGGLGVNVASKALGRLIAPVRDAKVQKLVDSGLDLTPGQIMGGTARRLEDSATSIPFLGDMIKGAQARSVQSLNKAVANQVLKPLGKEVPDNVLAGHDLVDHVYSTISDEYSRVLPNLSGKLDSQFASDLKNLRTLVKGLPPQQQAQFKNIVDGQLSKLSRQGGFTGETFKGIESELSKAVRGYTRDPSFDNRNLGGALDQVQRSLRQMLERQNPKYSGELSSINKAFAGYAKLRDAASSVGASEGVFTPAQLAQAVRRADSSAGKGAYARGEASFQDLSGPAKAILPPTVPDSGTPLRSLIGLGAGGLIAHGNPATAGAVVPAAVGISAASLPYTKAGQKLAQLLLTARPQGAQSFAEGVENASRSLGVRGITPLIQALRNEAIFSPQ